MESNATFLQKNLDNGRLKSYFYFEHILINKIDYIKEGNFLAKITQLKYKEEKPSMTLVEMMSIEKWIEIEKEINRRSGLNAAVCDAAGVRITDFKKWANNLCPAIRKTEKGLKYICSVAHQNIAAQALKTGQTTVAECDAGLMKFAVPIFVDGEFLGVAGGCGLLRGQEQVDAYLVHRTVGMEEQAVKNLSDDIETIPTNRLASVIGYLENTVTEIIQEYRTGK